MELNKLKGHYTPMLEHQFVVEFLGKDNQPTEMKPYWVNSASIHAAHNGSNVDVVVAPSRPLQVSDLGEIEQVKFTFIDALGETLGEYFFHVNEISMEVNMIYNTNVGKDKLMLYKLSFVSYAN